MKILNHEEYEGHEENRKHGMVWFAFFVLFVSFVVQEVDVAMLPA